MKKFIILSFTVLLAMIMNSAVYAADKVMLEENFEKYRVGDEVPEFISVSPDSKEEGTYAEIGADPHNSENKVLMLHSQNVRQECRIKFPKTGGKINLKFRASFQQATIQHLGNVDGVLMMMPYNGQFCINSEKKAGWGVPNIGLQYDKWYDFEYIIDISTKTFTIKCNNENIFVQDEPFMQSDTDFIDNIQFIDTNGLMCIDDVKVTTDGVIIKNYLKIESKKFKIDPNNLEISNVFYETTPKELLDNIEFIDGALYEIRTQDKKPYTGKYLTDGLVLNITSPIIDKELDFKIRVRPWIASLESTRAVMESVVFDERYDLHIRGNFVHDNGVKVFDNKHLYPLRAVCEGFGIPIGYDAQTKSVYVNNEKLENPFINNGITYVNEEFITGRLAKAIVMDYNGVVIIKNQPYEITDRYKNIISREITNRFGGR